MITNPYGFRNFGKKTAAAGTAYTYLIEPMTGYWPLINFLQFNVLGTAHTLTIMRPMCSQLVSGQTQRCSCYLTAAAAGAQAVININQDPGVYTAYTYNGSSAPRTANSILAAGDWLAFKYPDGSWGVDTVSSVSTLAITMTTNLGTGGLAAIAPVWHFGIPADTNPADAQAHPTFTLKESSTVNLGSEGCPVMGGFRAGDPLLLHVNNATAASILERGVASYYNRGGPFSS